MMEAILAAVIGGLITGVPAVWAVLRSNKVTRETAEMAAQLTRSQALAIELDRIRQALKGPDPLAALDAVDDLRALMGRVDSPLYVDDDRSSVVRLLQSRLARKIAEIERYPEHRHVELEIDAAAAGEEEGEQ